MEVGGFIMICMVMDAMFYLAMAMMMQGDGILK